MKHVVGRDRNGFAVLAHAHRRAVANPAVLHDHDGERRQVVLLPKNFQGLRRVRRRSLPKRARQENSSDEEGRRKPAKWISFHGGEV